MLIRLRVDPRLLEEVVHVELRRREGVDTALLDEHHRQADAIYQLPPEGREAEFAALHRRRFRELGFEARITGALAGQGGALAGLESLTLVRTLRPEDEGADLGGPEAGANAVVRVRAARFLAPDDLDRFLDHEMVHLADLLSEAFGHAPESLGGIPPHRRRLVQERYRAAWAASADGRLARRGRRPLTPRDEHRRALRHCFPALPDPELEALLERLWGDDRPTHAVLLAVAVGRGAREPRQPGTPCPLCGFPTHHWRDVSDGALIGAIHADVPDWEPDRGLCERCLEMYELRALTQA